MFRIIYFIYLIYLNFLYLIIKVITKAIPIFEHLHPGCVGIFAFDSSSGHSVYASDALFAHKMNLNPGGKQPLMRSGFSMALSRKWSFLTITQMSHFETRLKGCGRCSKSV